MIKVSLNERNQVEALLLFVPSLLLGETLEFATLLQKATRTSTLYFRIFNWRVSTGMPSLASEMVTVKVTKSYHRVGPCWMGFDSWKGNYRAFKRRRGLHYAILFGAISM